jgi:hypothetical protein
VITWESFAKTGSHLFFLVIIFVNEFFWLFQGVNVTGFLLAALSGQSGVLVLLDFLFK